ncbi:MAG: ABC transporter permease [Haloarculaceae archaeon]
MGSLARWRGRVGLGARLALSDVRRGGTRQTAVAIAGVALAVALVLSVTSVAVGLAVDRPVGGAADYWIVPADGAESAVADVEGNRLGNAHATQARLARTEGVTAATPVLQLVTGVRHDGDQETVLVLGVIADGMPVVGLPTAALEPGDPMYANGSYEGRRTGEAIVSRSAATALDLRSGESFELTAGAADSERGFRAVAVEAPRTPGVGQFPVVLVHLAELQAITGATEGDAADRVLVATSTPAARERIDDLYGEGNTRVFTRQQLLRERVADAQLPVTVAVIAFGVSLLVGALFIATTVGFELAATRKGRAVLRAIGMSRSGRLGVVVGRTLTVCLVGGALGTGLWAVVAAGLNLLPRVTGAGGGRVAVLHPLFVPAGVALAVGMGLLALPYLLVFGVRTEGMEVLRA